MPTVKSLALSGLFLFPGIWVILSIFTVIMSLVLGKKYYRIKKIIMTWYKKLSIILACLLILSLVFSWNTLKKD